MHFTCDLHTVFLWYGGLLGLRTVFGRPYLRVAAVG